MSGIELNVIRISFRTCKPHFKWAISISHWVASDWFLALHHWPYSSLLLHLQMSGIELNLIRILSQTCKSHIIVGLVNLPLSCSWLLSCSDESTSTIVFISPVVANLVLSESCQSPTASHCFLALMNRILPSYSSLLLPLIFYCHEKFISDAAAAPGSRSELNIRFLIVSPVCSFLTWLLRRLITLILQYLLIVQTPSSIITSICFIFYPFLHAPKTNKRQHKWIKF